MADEPRRCVAVLAVREGRVLLVRRTRPPRLGAWTLPGGGIDGDETALEAAARELHEETGLRGSQFLPVIVHVHRDQEAHLHIQVFSAHVHGEPIAGDDAGDARWIDLKALPAMDTTAVLLQAAISRSDAGGAATAAPPGA